MACIPHASCSPGAPGILGVMGKGDSGAPAYRTTSNGAELLGFFSAGVTPKQTHCVPGNPSLNNSALYPCYVQGLNVYATSALSSLGATLKIVS